MHLLKIAKQNGKNDWKQNNTKELTLFTAYIFNAFFLFVYVVYPLFTFCLLML